MSFGSGGGSSSLVGFQSFMNLMAGQRQMGAAYEEADMIREQSNIILDEYDMEARRRAREVELFRQSQMHGYLSQGILTDSGSPAVVEDETRRLGQQEVDAIRKRGRAEATLMRYQANKVERAGLENLMGINYENASNKIQDDQRKAQQRSQFWGGVLKFGFDMGGQLLGSLF